MCSIAQYVSLFQSIFSPFLIVLQSKHSLDRENGSPRTNRFCLGPIVAKTLPSPPEPNPENNPLVPGVYTEELVKRSREAAKARQADAAVEQEVTKVEA